MKALEKLNVWRFHPNYYKMPKEFQKVPLRMIFNIKKEDLRRKARYMVEGYKIDSLHLESYSSVVKTMSM